MKINQPQELTVLQLLRSKLILFFSLEQSGSTSNMVYPNNPAKELTLDNAGAFSSATTGYWNNTAPSSTVINMGSSWGQYHSYYGGDSVAYCFADVAGMQKIDSYTGNGSTSGPLVATGFEPAFLMVKRTDSNDSWIILDNKRDTANPRNNSLKWDEDGQEEADSSNRTVDFLSNGFQIKTTHQGMNANNGTYLYLAIAANGSTTTPTLADSFNIATYTGNSSTTQSITGVGFKPDFVWQKARSSTYSHFIIDSLRGRNSSLIPNSTTANNAGSGADKDLISFDSDGMTFGPTHQIYGKVNGTTYVTYNWKTSNNQNTINTNGSINSIVSANANAGFSIVKWAGNGSAATIGHGLNAAPEMIITKRLTGTSPWYTYNAYLNGGTNPAHYFVNLNTTAAETSNGSSGGSLFNSTPPTSTIFNIGTSLSGSGDEYIAYCFHSVSGYSKFGSYSGNGGTQSITGLGFQPDFVLLKETTAAESWRLFDSARTATKRLFPDLTNAESTASDSLTAFDSNGFSLNQNGETYIYMAFKIN